MALTLLQELLDVSERAAEIARLIRAEKELFGALIEEKENDHIKQDYKTLADVVIQATVKYHVATKFPQMKDRIKGEESSRFVNRSGVEMFIDISDQVDSTVKQLITAFDGRDQLAERLAKVVHGDREAVPIDGQFKHRLECVDVDLGQLGIWIDPIDGTNEYVGGVSTEPVNGILDRGLQVVMVLIGVHDTLTGMPVMGVVNQPFCSKDKRGNWNGHVVWGMTKDGHTVTNVPYTVAERESSRRKVCLVGHIDKIVSKDWDVRCVSGCGYKLLCVINGLADVFVLTQPSSYKWDTCGPQVMSALGGGAISWAEFVRGQRAVPLLYHRSDDPTLEDGARRWRNVGGVIGYHSLLGYTHLHQNKYSMVAR